MVTIDGGDYAWSHPSPAALRAAGWRFAARYLSHDPKKNLTRTEAVALAAAGISCVVVWESAADRALTGRPGGIADARTAAAQAEAAGMPATRPIYFAVDFDASAAQQLLINAYLDGAASVIGAARVGIYGGYYPVKRALDGGHAHWGWQTRAWSGGQWDTRAVIRQGATKNVGGADCDLDTALAADYGQWTPGHVPTTEDIMTPEQEKKLDTLIELARGPGNQAYRNAAADAAQVKKTGKHIPDVYGYTVSTFTGVQQLIALVGALRATIATLTATPAATVAEIEAASEAGASKALAEHVVHVAVHVDGTIEKEA